MQYWTKNGSIPSTETDGTEGWQPAPEPPTDVPDGHELLWASGEWHVLTPKPTEPGTWRWYVGVGWVKRVEKNVALPTIEALTTIQLDSFTSSQITNLTTAQVI